MKTHPYLPVSGIGAGLLACSILWAEMIQPPGAVSDFDKKLVRDVTEARPAAPVNGSYSPVVERILPSVVSIQTFARHSFRSLGRDIGREDIDQLPPLFRDFFEDWLNRQGPGSSRDRRHSRPRKPAQTGLGSGVIITADGYVLTNNHVVDGAEELKVGIRGRSTTFTARVIGTDPQTDVALIKIDASGLAPATLGDSSHLHIGDLVLAVGSPIGLEQSVTHGIVSGLGRTGLGIIGNPQLGQPGYENFIQTDAAINPGNSGGPLLDVSGRVVGLNAAIETRSGMFAGIGLAIPINMVLTTARDLVEGGKVQRGYLGIEMEELDAAMADYLGLEHEGGVIVNSVVADSPAEKAGFHEGDAILTVNELKVTSPAELRLMVSSHHPGTSLKFGVVRFNEKLKRAEHLELVASLKSLPEKPGPKREGKASKEPPASSPASSFIKGITTATLTDELRREYSVPELVEGVVVAAVDKDSPAAAVLEEGDVIQQVNHQPVKTVAEARARKADGGPLVLLKILRSGHSRLVVVKD